MKISIITVVLNSEKTIEDTIRSVFSQRYPNIEYIVIDGGSTDGTLQIINKYRKQINYFSSGKDSGIYDAMNKGIHTATGDVIGILNADDVYSDDYVIERVMREFANFPGHELVYGDLVYVKPENLSKVVRTWKSKEHHSRFFEHANVPPHPALFLNREVFMRAGLFDLQYDLAADYEFMLRVFKKHDFRSRYIPGVMVKMRLGGATNRSIKNIYKGNLEILRAWRNNGLRVPVLLMPLRVLKRLKQFA